MSFPTSTTILIVGAGPTGLATALSLIHYGCRDFVIVDAVLQGENTSRAIVIHAATLEALDIIGCGHELVESGFKAHSVSICTPTAELVRGNITYLQKYTPHPYVLFVPQISTEQILGEKLRQLGVHVYRPKKVAFLKRNSQDPSITDVAFDDGSVLEAKYVIGADGARSTVRAAAGIGFADPDGEVAADHNLAQMVLADITFKGADNSNGMLNIVLSPDNIFLCLPLPASSNKTLARHGEDITGRVFRVVCGVPLREGAPPSSPSKEYLQILVNRFGQTKMSSDPSVNPNPVEIDQVLWSTRFRTHSAIADRTFARLGPDEDEESTQTAKEGGILFLIGDAAHIHSPAGGQGMNLGIRDAVFLGEAITKHIQMSASPTPGADVDAILRDFAATRHQRALEVIRYTKDILNVGGAKYDTRLFGFLPISPATVRDWVAWTLGKIPFVQERIVWQLSGLGRR
ncbi:hypothetical protein BJ138DRAFT_1142299 [Hygrophoropsis aurantiaca]|uniref:Uncharacterized protein n=1 Tax=Hygrophoropsis aurantiaca TaxID=72124 RepID=A0ACB8ANW1_9AGAM|nr:hypothetical protein BJ138DRAFT_1142299 [Hygrophoropsis aurantiaca]